jgi:hypothetical protein
MPLTGDAKTAYQREYMRRRRAAAGATKTTAPSELLPSEEQFEAQFLAVLANKILDERLSPDTSEKERRDAWLRMVAAILGFKEWLEMASDNAIGDMTKELTEDCERWEKEYEEEEAAESAD